VFTCGLPWVIAYSPADGKELFRAKVMDGDVATSPLWHGGVLYVANDRAMAAAIRCDGSGDVTEKAVIWSNREVTLPDMVSPLTDGKYVLLTHGGGEANCLDAQTGKVVWTQDMGSPMSASPILAGKLVYLMDKTGTTHVFELKETFEEIRTCKLNEEVTASPAVLGGHLYIRGKENLYCIGAR
jgi:outer membrane protein assembly factor BamB